MNSFIEQLILKKSQILSLLVEHVELTLISVLVAVVIGVPLGIIITKNKKLAKTVIGFANLTQAIPSLAILGFLIPLIGIGSAPAITMVVLYSMLPILKNTYTGITNINPDMLEAAKGLGMTNTQTLKLIKIPLAMPIIMAGIRIASVTAVGLMTIAAFIGAGGLGYLVFSGIQTVDNNLILFGAIPAAILALVIDWVTGKIEDATMPNGIKKADGTMKIKRSSSNKSRKRNTIIAAIVGACLVLPLIVSNLIGMGHKKVVIGSKNFTEQLILGNILEELIKDKTDIDVETKLNLGGTQVSFNALKAGGIDMYVEYTGTAYGNILNIKEPNRDKDVVYNRVKKDFKEKFGIEVLNPIGFNNTYAMATTKEIAQKYNLKTTSDLAKESSNMIAGPTIEFANREDGLIGLNKAYNVNFKGVKPIDGGLRYTALVNNETQIIDAFTTDGLIEQFNLVLLEDDKRFFPDYYAVPIVKEETLKKFPELREVLGNLDGRITDEKMRKLNYEVDVNKRDPKQVAKEFLQKEGLID
ncbi:ABC transporter permease subunit [Clostridium botulinum]|uniref:ABC transporter permease subunit n=1 Tax=Clostridium botulinum TaxID=1491 RepID=A0A846JB48_CLOBO|nr:glycine betaine ABC transporter substrate-binding protein [Clostridium botulinum]ACA55879.1 glycine betaine/L-proline ABC transporter, permease/glycine betaine/L-proline-binding protein [Clostridium botulinum A3 str. Loch Maree]NFH65822.1 ABC transporter permease subunit [Clostridium botulinum]NFJ10391.1 ABC transporter permease subunit [Clostridium botulinum]NFK15331.1 ABC transporter permease subunit [Clostridium botulinum]NFM93646.1 ABC transporter permease subunit [Clostridium botulinum